MSEQEEKILCPFKLCKCNKNCMAHLNGECVFVENAFAQQSRRLSGEPYEGLNIDPDLFLALVGRYGDQQEVVKTRFSLREMK